MAPGLAIIWVFLFIQMDLIPSLISITSLGLYHYSDSILNLLGTSIGGPGINPKTDL